MTLFDYMDKHPVMTLVLAFLMALVVEQFARRR